MSYDVPHEVMKIAQAIVDATSSRMDEIDRHALALQIERAIMAERERAAKVAEKWEQSDWIDEVFAARSIAAAIREPLPMTNPKPGERE